MERAGFDAVGSAGNWLDAPVVREDGLAPAFPPLIDEGVTAVEGANGAD